MHLHAFPYNECLTESKHLVDLNYEALGTFQIPSVNQQNKIVYASEFLATGTE